jgi:sulfite oxidase
MWGKRGDMAVRRRAPFNAEPPSSVLAAAEITALDTFYSRNHGAIPDITPHQWRLTVDKPVPLTYDQLIEGFTPHSVVTTLACAATGALNC